MGLRYDIMKNWDRWIHNTFDEPFKPQESYSLKDVFSCFGLSIVGLLFKVYKGLKRLNEKLTVRDD